jgi:hypothetical protein
LKAGQTYFYSQIVTIANEYPAVSPRNWTLKINSQF